MSGEIMTYAEKREAQVTLEKAKIDINLAERDPKAKKAKKAAFEDIANDKEVGPVNPELLRNENL